MTSLPPEAEYPMMFTCCPDLMFLPLPDWRYIDFQTGHFAAFERFKFDTHFAYFGKVKIDLIRSLLLALDRSQLYLLRLGKICREKQSESSPFDKKFKNHA